LLDHCDLFSGHVIFDLFVGNHGDPSRMISRLAGRQEIILTVER
jgi:hypothetical protein